MTWIHVSVPRAGTVGDCVALSHDRNFQGRNISDKMKRHYYHFHVNEPLEDLVEMINPVYGPDEIVEGDPQPTVTHKYRGFIDYLTKFPPATVANIVDRDRPVDPDARVTYRKSDFGTRT